MSGHVLRKRAPRPLFILGAGVDKPLGFPLMSEVMGSLHDFKKGEGAEIEKVLKKKVPYLSFDFERYAGNKGTMLGSSLLGDDPTVLEHVKQIVNSEDFGDNEESRSLRLLVERLDAIRIHNTLSAEDSILFAKAIHNETDRGATTILDASAIRFTEMPRQLVREALKRAYDKAEGEGDARTKLYDLLITLSNFEELLSDFFIGFFTKNPTAQKRYFYLSWLFWMYLRFQEAKVKNELGNSFYGLLEEMSDFDLITFNYTRFSRCVTNGQATYFHGDSESMIDFRTRRMKGVEHLKDTRELKLHFDQMQPEFGATPSVVLPGLVPPLIMKPLMASEYLDWWYRAAKLIEEAELIVIAGYSFSFPDEHFNDLIRKRASGAKFLVIDPYWDSVCLNLPRVLDETATPESLYESGIECRRMGRILFARADSKDLSSQALSALISLA
ncbi:MAG: hypothetical protein WD716_03555 [Fimbriimonadaceae bacterium]